MCDLLSYECGGDRRLHMLDAYMPTQIEVVGPRPQRKKWALRFVESSKDQSRSLNFMQRVSLRNEGAPIKAFARSVI